MVCNLLNASENKINEVAKVVSTKKEAQAVVDCIFDTITKTLKKRLLGQGGSGKKLNKFIKSFSKSFVNSFSKTAELGFKYGIPITKDIIIPLVQAAAKSK